MTHYETGAMILKKLKAMYLITGTCNFKPKRVCIYISIRVMLEGDQCLYKPGWVRGIQSRGS